MISTQVYKLFRAGYSEPLHPHVSLGDAVTQEGIREEWSKEKSKEKSADDGCSSVGERQILAVCATRGPGPGKAPRTRLQPSLHSSVIKPLPATGAVFYTFNSHSPRPSHLFPNQAADLGAGIAFSLLRLWTWMWCVCSLGGVYRDVIAHYCQRSMSRYIQG